MDDVTARLRAALSGLRAEELRDIHRHLTRNLQPFLEQIAAETRDPEVAATPTVLAEALTDIRTAADLYDHATDLTHAYLAEHAAPPSATDSARREAEQVADRTPGPITGETPTVVAPTPDQAPTRPLDDLPPPVIVRPPTPLPEGATDDPTTWPGRIVPTEDPRVQPFDQDEEEVARRLARSGPNIVERLPTSTRREADALVNGYRVEFKTLTTGAAASYRTVKGSIAASQRRGGQSDDVIIDARRTEITSADAIRGLAAFLNAPGGGGRLRRVRVWGPDFDLDWKRG